MDPLFTICCSIYLYLNRYNHQWSLSTAIDIWQIKIISDQVFEQY